MGPSLSLIPGRKSSQEGFLFRDTRTWRKWNLCQQCRECLVEGPTMFTVLTLDYAKTRKAEGEGCGFCRVLCNVVDWDRQRQHQEGNPDNLQKIYFTTLNGGHLSIKSPINDPFSRDTIFLNINPEAQKPGATSPGNSLSSGSISFIQNQLVNCLRGHGLACGSALKFSEPQWLARVLQIDGDSVRLIAFGTGTMPGQYTALSYSWGTQSQLERSPPFKATVRNIHDLHSGVCVIELPLTIQQAILVCKILDIHYIWIDSLCIIQGSKSDWANEATKMESVYSNAKLTIIAASSTSCHSGFLGQEFDYTPLTTPPKSPFQITINNRCRSGFHNQRQQGYGLKVDPIDGRGWTLQEEVLSCRYLKFTRDDIQWSCRAQSTCMCGQKVFPDLRQKIDNHSKEGENAWKDFIEELSRRHFTQETDKLVAISSLAKRMATRFEAPEGQIPYIAGMWRSIFVRQLAWFCRSRGARMTDSYIPPSFSWASLNFNSEGMAHMSTITDEICQVRDAGVSPVLEGNGFGAVSGGFVSLYGPVIRGSILLRKDHRPTMILQMTEPEFKLLVVFDCPVSENLHSDGYRTLKRCRDPLESTVGEFHVEMLFLGASMLRDAIFLVLGRVENNCYQRIGYARSIQRKSKMDGKTLHMLESAKEEIIII